MIRGVEWRASPVKFRTEEQELAGNRRRTKKMTMMRINEDNVGIEQQ
jgi:hypothetical protein